MKTSLGHSSGYDEILEVALTIKIQNRVRELSYSVPSSKY
jgi:hypothetical protein